MVAGSLVAVYIGDGRYHPAAPKEAVFDPRLESEPGMMPAEKTMTAEQTSPPSGGTDAATMTVTFQP